MADERKPGDPADRVADGAFGGVHSHRAGYGGNELDGRVFTREEWIERSARQGGTLAAGEGKVLVEELDRLRAAVVEGMAKVARAERILAALREPSQGALDAATAAMEEANFYVMDLKTPPPTMRQQQDKVFVAGVRAAVAAAEQEVERG